MNAAALLAQRAYGATQSATAMGADQNGPMSAAAAGGGFAQLLAGQVSGAIDASKAAEAQASQAVTGHGELVDVVTAISAAEVQMETMVSFRDAAISAYQEIMRMPI